MVATAAPLLVDEAGRDLDLCLGVASAKAGEVLAARATPMPAVAERRRQEHRGRQEGEEQELRSVQRPRERHAGDGGQQRGGEVDALRCRASRLDRTRDRRDGLAGGWAWW